MCASFVLRNIVLGTVFCGTAVGAFNHQEHVVSAPRGVVAPLNRITFAGNVLAEDSIADRWFVLYCVGWYSPCEDLRREFMAVANQHERMNADRLFSSAVRFGEVSCATDKVLCNEQLVETYPTVVHYIGGKRQLAWEGNGEISDRKRLSRWTEKQMSPQAPRQEDAPQDAVPVRHVLRVAGLVVAGAAAAISMLSQLPWAALFAAFRQRDDAKPGKKGRAAAGEEAKAASRGEPLVAPVLLALRGAWGGRRASIEL
jgi:hypothetical protein